MSSASHTSHVTCSVCSDDCIFDPGAASLTGLSCSFSHFTCSSCLNGLACAELSAEHLRERRGVRCPFRGALGPGGKVDVCSSHPFTVQQLQRVLTAEAFAQVLSDALGVLDSVGEELKRKSEELEKVGGAAAARMLEAEKAAAGQRRADRINTLRAGLIEAHLVLRCPRCSAAFADYAGCDAVTCGRPGCGCGFCGARVVRELYLQHGYPISCPFQRSASRTAALMRMRI